MNINLKTIERLFEYRMPNVSVTKRVIQILCITKFNFKKMQYLNVRIYLV